MDELRPALELGTEEELQQLTHILFCRRFNPLDYLQGIDPIDVQSKDREIWLDSLEQRFRYLAADGFTVIKGTTQEITYRQILIQVCRYLRIYYSENLSTTDIEAEIFLHLVSEAWQKLPTEEKRCLTTKVQKSLAQSKFPEPLPVGLQHNPINIVLKGSSILAISSVLKPLILQQIARQFALHFASYQVARNTILRGGAAATAQFQGHLAMQAAKRGMAMTTARHAAVRGVFAMLGPLLWGCFFADLGWRAIATNYGRIIPTIFALAQIRLTRDAAWETVDLPC